MKTIPIRFHITGMDCPSCVAKIEGAVRKVPGVHSVRVSLTSQTMMLETEDPGAMIREVEAAVRKVGYDLAPVTSSPEASRDDDDDLPKDLGRISPAYRRALWTVVLLNLGYGAVEIIGGLIAGSQALKADALDFLGDGFITFLGLLAARRSMKWRARAALIQGLFLGGLGLGVLGTTFYRVLVTHQPEAELMGLFGGIALAVNVVAALVLIPHRAGDASVRAVWLFSRNDAIGNLAVVFAAGLVRLTGRPWPDLLVAFIIAGLFLQSAWSIVKDARRELSELGAASST